MNSMPHELVWGEVYFPPLLLVIALAYILTILVGTVATKLGVHKYLAFPALAEPNCDFYWRYWSIHNHILRQIP